MTDTQISNWRTIIFRLLEEKRKGAGSYAFVMKKEEIEEFKDMVQDYANKKELTVPRPAGGQSK